MIEQRLDPPWVYYTEEENEAAYQRYFRSLPWYRRLAIRWVELWAGVKFSGLWALVRRARR